MTRRKDPFRWKLSFIDVLLIAGLLAGIGFAIFLLAR
jgi:hypothetical protein